MGSSLGKYLSMTSSTSWNDVVNKIKGVTISTRSVSQSITKDYWLSGDNTFLTRIDVDATGVYNNGYNAGRSQGRSDVTSNPNGYGLYTKSQYDANYNNGYSAGNVSISKVHAIEVTPGSSSERAVGSWSYKCPSNGIILGTCTRGNPWLSVNGSAKSGTSVTGGYQYIISVSKGNVVTPANKYVRPNIWFIGS